MNSINLRRREYVHVPVKKELTVNDLFDLYQGLLASGLNRNTIIVSNDYENWYELQPGGYYQKESRA